MPMLARRLDQLAKRHGATIMGSGAQDVFWLTLPSVLMGAAHDVVATEGCVPVEPSDIAMSNQHENPVGLAAVGENRVATSERKDAG